jgi:hypothetical protein
METYINFMGFDFICDIDISIHSFGEAPSGLYGPPEFYDPGSGPDFTIYTIHLSLDGPSPGPKFEATGALFKCLVNSRSIDDAILSYISEQEDDCGC